MTSYRNISKLLDSMGLTTVQTVANPKMGHSMIA